MMDKSNTKTPAIKNINDLPLVLTISEVSEILGIGKNTAYDLVRCGAIKSFRAGRQIRVSKSALLEFQSENIDYPPRMMYHNLSF